MDPLWQGSTIFWKSVTPRVTLTLVSANKDVALGVIDVALLIVALLLFEDSILLIIPEDEATLTWTGSEIIVTGFQQTCEHVMPR